MTISIPITRGLETLIDDSDVEVVSGLKWHAHPSHGSGGRALGHYACARRAGRTIYLHRLLLDAPKGKQVDHINGDKLDNRRANLRLATASENSANRSDYRPSSGFRGVYRNKKGWSAMISWGGRLHHLGTWGEREKAALAYDQAALEQFGQFATLNFSLEQRA